MSKDEKSQTLLKSAGAAGIAIAACAACCQAKLNECPRKTLLYQTPAEKFAECVAAIG